MMDWPSDLPCDAIHLWTCPGLLSSDLDHALVFLAPDEQERAGRYRFEQDRWRYLGGILLQRVVLAHYLWCPSRKLSFSRNQWGKPSLDQRCGLKFSLSRSHEVAILAVCAGAEVGADLEFARVRNKWNLRMKEHFSEGEREFIDRAPDSEKAFFEIWARKEAYVKGIGRGLSHPLEEFDVSPSETNRVRDWSAGAPDETWQVQTIELPEQGYAAAISTTLTEFSVQFLQIGPDDLVDRISGLSEG